MTRRIRERSSAAHRGKIVKSTPAFFVISNLLLESRCSSEVFLLREKRITVWSRGRPVNGESVPRTNVSARLASAITELRALQEPLLSGEVDPRVLVDFRDALNRIRNTAWAAQQSAAAPFFDQGATTVASYLTSERIRAAYQLCRFLHDDVCRDDIEFQKGQLVELYGVAKTLVDELKERL
jgi:hypothetical protein